MDKKPVVGNWNYTPRQMATVNAQREARGQAPLQTRNANNPDSYNQEYDSYYDEIQRRKKKQSPQAESKPTSLKERMEASTSDYRKKREEEQSEFRERFRKKQAPPTTGMRGAISTSPGYNYKNFTA